MRAYLLKVILIMIAFAVMESFDVPMRVPIIISVFTVYTIYSIMWHQNRGSIFDKIAAKKRFKIMPKSTAGHLIICSQMSMFKHSDCKAGQAIYTEKDRYKIILADITVTKDFRDGGNSSNGRYGGRNGALAEAIAGSISSFQASCCVVIDQDLYLPVSTVIDETILEKAIASIGGQDIDFDEDPAFSNRFTLQGPSEVNIRDFYTKKVRNALIQAMPGGFALETAEDRIMIYTKGHASSNELEIMTDVIQRLYKIFKEAAFDNVHL